MINSEKVIVMDIDGSICEKRKENQEYANLKPIFSVLNKLKEYKEKGFYVILYTARQMRTYEGNIGKINANTAKVLFQWLEDYEVPYDEIIFGKPWNGNSGFYVDDKAIRPNEFVDCTYDEILKLVN